MVQYTPLKISAVRNDLQQLKSLMLPYRKLILKNFLGSHLWYLAQENVALTLFVSQVSWCTTWLMVAAMAKEYRQDESKRVTLDQITTTNKNLEDFGPARS